MAYNFIRHKDNTKGYDCFSLKINVTVKLLCLFCCIILITDQGIYPDNKCNFVQTKMETVQKMVSIAGHYFEQWVMYDCVLHY